MHPWCLQFCWRDLKCFPSYCFPLFLCTSHWRCLSYLSLLFLGTLHSEKAGLKLNIKKTKIMVSGPIISQQIEGEKVETVTEFIFLSFKITVDGDWNLEIKSHLLLLRKADKPRQCFKKQSHHFVDKGPYNQSYGFSNSHVWMWELDHEEGWVLKNWCFWIVLEKTLESLLDCKEIKPVNSKGNQLWIFIWRTYAETPVFWPPIQRANLLKKTLMLGKIEGRRIRGWQSMRWLDDITDSKGIHLSKLQETVKNRKAWCAAVHGVTKSGTRLNDWTITRFQIMC